MTTALAPGDMLGVYRVEQELGCGAVGIVYSGVAPGGEPVAIKVLRPELARDARFLARFDHEARAAQAIESNHLVPLLDVGEDRGRRFLVSRLMRGGTLRMLLDQRGPLPLDRLVAHAADIARGLDAMHSHGLLHRDVKPSNVLFDDGGRARVADFGLAKGVAYTVLTKPGEVMGTLDYLAPELVRGHDASRATDIYALGCVVYECAVGVAPFADKGMLGVGMAHLSESPPDPAARRPELPASVAWAILTALAKEPDRRPPSATAYAHLLRAAGPAGSTDQRALRE